VQLPAALDALATFYTDNTLAQRRALRSTMERRRAAGNREFLDAFAHVHAQVARLERHTETMATLCADMQTRLDAARAQRTQLTEPAAALAAEG
jgi:conserved oligomeric Golgi complex subunit 6